MIRLFPFIFILLLTLVACEKDDPDPLVAKLNNTAWTPLKLEVVEAGVVTRTLEPDFDFNEDRLAFNAKGKLSKYGSPAMSGCGAWSVAGGKLRFIVSGPLVIPNLCDRSNVTQLFSGNASATETQNELVIHTIGAAFDHYNHIEDWHEVILKSASPDVVVRVYFSRADPGTPPEQGCCAKFGWM